MANRAPLCKAPSLAALLILPCCCFVRREVRVNSSHFPSEKPKSARCSEMLPTKSSQRLAEEHTEVGEASNQLLKRTFLNVFFLFPSCFFYLLVFLSFSYSYLPFSLLFPFLISFSLHLFYTSFTLCFFFPFSFLSSILFTLLVISCFTSFLTSLF